MSAFRENTCFEVGAQSSAGQLPKWFVIRYGLEADIYEQSGCDGDPLNTVAISQTCANDDAIVNQLQYYSGVIPKFNLTSALSSEWIESIGAPTFEPTAGPTDGPLPFAKGWIYENYYNGDTCLVGDLTRSLAVPIQKCLQEYARGDPNTPVGSKLYNCYYGSERK